MIGALRQRDFALLWLGQLISLVGDWVLIVGLPIFVYLLTRSVLATSLMLLAARVPSVALGAIAGLLVDRWDRRRTLIAVNLLLALGLLPLLLVQSADRIWIVYGVALVESCLVQFVSPAANALLPTLVKEEDLVAANSLNSLSGSLGRLVGPALGGIIGAWFALGGVALADAASFALAATLIALVTPGHKIALRASDAPPPAEGALTRIWNEWRDGLRVIAAERVLTTLLGILTITALGEGVFGVLYPVFVSRVLHGAALEVGQLMSAQAIGGLIGGLVVGWLGSRVTSRWVMGACCVAFGLLDLAIFNVPSVIPSYPLEVGLFVAVGIPGVAMTTGLLSLLQSRSPAAFRGRVFGALNMTSGLLGLVGTLTAGAVTDRLGVVTVLTIQGMGYVVAGLLLIVLLRSLARRVTSTGQTGDAVVALDG